MKDLDRALRTSRRSAASLRAVLSSAAMGRYGRGYRLLALFAAGQALSLPDPAATPLAYLALWVGMRRSPSCSPAPRWSRARAASIRRLADEMLHAAIEQFIPAGVAGTLLTVVIYPLRAGACGCCPACGRSCSASACSPPAARCPRHVRGRRLVSRRRPRELALASGAPVLALRDGRAVRHRPVLMAFVLYRATGETRWRRLTEERAGALRL